MPAAKPCWDVLFCMIFYEWNGKLFDRTISVPGTDNQELVNLVAQQVGGKGGGRPDMAQAGGTQPDAVPAALQSVHSWLEERL